MDPKLPLPKHPEDQIDTSPEDIWYTDKEEGYDDYYDDGVESEEDEDGVESEGDEDEILLKLMNLKLDIDNKGDL